MQRTTTMCKCCTTMLSYCYNVTTVLQQHYTTVTLVTNNVRTMCTWM